MANSLAISTVTATLRNLLMTVTSELPDAVVTAKPPHRARQEGDRSNQLNLFLYQTAPNTVWRDQDVADHSRSMNRELPPLALNLYYFLTAYGRDDEDLLSHRLLGHAMAILHSHTVLTSAELRVAVPGNDLYQQVEQVRITPQALMPEELSRLWSLFQIPYNLSVAYQVSVVLINSPSSSSAALDKSKLSILPPQQAVSQTEQLCVGLPILVVIILSGQSTHVVPGSVLTLRGRNLQGDRVKVYFHHGQFPQLSQMALPLRWDNQEIIVEFPSQAEGASPWVAGFYKVSARIQRVNTPIQDTNVLSLAVIPQILSLARRAIANAVDAVDPKTETWVLTCQLAVLPEQSASLMIGSSAYPAANLQEIPAQPRSQITSNLIFQLPRVLEPQSIVILRVEGIDSPPVRWSELTRHRAAVSDSTLEVTP